MAWVGHQLFLLFTASVMRQGFVRVVGMFPELQFLVKGFISSFSAVFWGSILMWIATWLPIAQAIPNPPLDQAWMCPESQKSGSVRFKGCYFRPWGFVFRKRPAAEVILMWAIIAVYFVDPTYREIVQSLGDSCEDELGVIRNCRAWSSVGDSEP